MDPVTIIVTALTLGAVAGLKDNAADVVKDAYSGIKTLILRKYGDVGLSGLEKKPESQAKKDSVAEDLEDAGAGEDEELLRQAQALTHLVEQYAPETAAEVNVKLADMKAIGSFRIEDLKATGDQAKINVDVKKIDAGGDIEIKGLHAKGGNAPESKK